MNQTAIQLTAAFFGSLGFAAMFHLRKELLLEAALGGLLTWAIYLLLGKNGIFVPCLLASAFAAAYAEILARIRHVPATLFVIPAAVPLVPGSYLYYGMLAAVQGDSALATQQFYFMAEFAVAIALGMSIIWTVIFMMKEAEKKRRNP